MQKAPSSTVGDLATALARLVGKAPDLKVIGTRHGEKLFETLVSREEMARAQDLDHYFRVPADSRDLNYERYFVAGQPELARIDDYTSHNTKRLDMEGLMSLLSGLDMVKAAMHA